MSGFTRRITGAQAVTNALRSLGINFDGVVSESSDPNAVLMWFLATRAGQRLLEEADWQFLYSAFEINTSVGVNTYALPADFNKFSSDASWNFTTRLPVVGSLTTAEWQMLKARQITGTTFTMLYRISNDVVELYDPPSIAQRLVLPYHTRGWVAQADGNKSDNLELESDTVLFDRQLFEAALRLEWDTEKKFDTTASAAAYNTALVRALGKDVPSRTLTLNKRGGYPYLGTINIPSTNYG